MKTGIIDNNGCEPGQLVQEVVVLHVIDPWVLGVSAASVFVLFVLLLLARYGERKRPAPIETVDWPK